MRRVFFCLLWCATLFGLVYAQTAPVKVGAGKVLFQEYNAADCTTIPGLDSDDKGVKCWDTDDEVSYTWTGTAWTVSSGGGSPPAGDAGDLQIKSSGGTLAAIPDSDWNGTTLTLPQVETPSLDLDGDGTPDIDHDGSRFIFTDAAQQSRHLVRYMDLDTDGDGTIDERIVGDYDGDGSLQFEDDIEAALDDLVDPDGDGTPLSRDLDGDGTADGAGVTLTILPGDYAATFRETYTLRASHVTIRGSGQDSTWIRVGGGCDGSADALDDGDTTDDKPRLFTVLGDELSVTDISFDGGSTRWSDAADGNCNINDVDGDGSQNTGDGTPGGSCATYWCPLDSHYIFVFSADPAFTPYTHDAGSYFSRVRFTNVDRNPIYWNYAPNMERAKVIGCTFEGSGEHILSNPPPRSVIQGNTLRDGWNPIVIAGTTGVNEQISIIGNDFDRCIGYCIGTEILDYNTRDIRVQGNNFECDDTSACTGSAIYLVGGDYDSDGTNDGIQQGWNISNNTLRYTGPQISGALVGNSHVGTDTAASIENLVIANNVIKYDPDASATLKGALALNNVDSFTIVGNVIEVDGDATSTGDTLESGVYFGSRASNGTITSNQITLTGTGTYGISIGALATKLTLSNNIISGPAVASAATGIRVLASDANTIAANTFVDLSPGILLTNTSTDGATQNMVTSNSCFISSISASNCITLNNSATKDNVVRGNFSRNGAGSWCWTSDTSAAGNVWADNTCLGGYVTSSPGGARTNVLADLGVTWVADETSLADFDATGEHYYHDASGINLDDDALAIKFRTTSGLFVGTCGSSECLVYDIDADATIDSDDICLLNGGPDSNCDGTAETGGGAGGAPTTATYITQTPDAGLDNEQALSTLAHNGLVEINSSGVISAFVGSSCSDGVTYGLQASGDLTCQDVTLTTHTQGILALAQGGTSNTTWTAGRCVQVSADGTKLESAAAACGSGGGGSADGAAGAVQLSDGAGGFESDSDSDGSPDLLYTGGSGLAVDGDGTARGTVSSSNGVTIDGSANGVRIAGLANCDTIDTDANGLLACGTDGGGTGGGAGVAAGMTLASDFISGYDTATGDATTHKHDGIGWTYRESQAASSISWTASASSPSILRILTSGVVGSGAHYQLAGGSHRLGDPVSQSWRVRLKMSATASTDMIHLYSGWMTSTTSTSDPTTGVYIQAISDLDSTAATILGTCHDGAASSTVNLGTLSATFQDFEIRVTASGTAVEFFVDGVSQGSCSGNIPSATTAMSPTLFRVIVQEAVDKILDIDAWEWQQTLAAERW